MPEAIDTERLEQIESQLASDVLTDDELATALYDAGLPELSRVVRGLARRGRPVGPVAPPTATGEAT